MENMPAIPKSEFSERVKRAQGFISEAGLDALLVHSNEAEMANVRYFSNYWPIFESAGVLIPAEGEPALLIGPESETFARDRSRIPAIHKLVEYREPAEPEYPDIEIATFDKVFKEHCGKVPQRVGIGGWAVLPLPVWMGLKDNLPDTEFIKADDIMHKMRPVKSSAEIECIKAAFRISEKALKTVLDIMKPGMTELELVGKAQEVMYSEGAEYEGHPVYVLSAHNTAHAISRPTSRVINEGDIVQLNIGARVNGYSSSVGRPVCMGRMSEQIRELVEFGLEAHKYSFDMIKPGIPASLVATDYEEWVKSKGYGEYLLYGPFHGLGIIEVEPPWIEKTSKYDLVPGMTFQTDTFFYTPEGSKLAKGGVFGLRWESGIVVTETGNEVLSTDLLEIVEKL